MLKKHTDATKDKIKKKRNSQIFTTESLSKRGVSIRKRWESEPHPNKGVKRSHEIVRCPHCNKEGIKPNMIRWHFTNCKVNTL